MAELVGAVASGFTLAGVAVGSARAVMRLRQLWNEVKEVPATIRGLMDKVELLESIIAEMEVGSVTGPVGHESFLGSKTALARSTEHCQRQLKGLYDLVIDLEADINAQRRSKRVMTKTKVALGKGKLAEFERRMRESVDVLVIAMNARNLLLSELNLRYTKDFGNIMRQTSQCTRPDAIAEVDSKGIEADDRALEAPCNKTTSASQQELSQGDHQTLSKTKVKPGLFGGLLIKSRTINAGLQPAAEYEFQACAPAWLYGKAFDFQASRARGAWTLSLRTYNVRPSNSPVFTFARDTKYNELFSLLEQRKASVFDCDEQGDTILHYMFGAKNLDMNHVKSLLDAGADPNIPNSLDMTPLCYWLSGGNDKVLYENLRARGVVEPAVRSVTEASWALFFLDSITNPRRKKWYENHFTDFEAHEIMCHHGQMLVSGCCNFLREEEMGTLGSALNIWASADGPGMFGFWYGISAGHSSTGKIVPGRCPDLALEVLRGASSVHGQIERRWKLPSMDFICRFVPPLHGIALTPLLHFLTGAWVLSCSQPRGSHFKIVAKTMAASLRRWLHVVDEAGYSLEEYGRVEQQLLTTGIVRHVRWNKVGWRDDWVPDHGWQGGLWFHMWNNPLRRIRFTAPKLVDIKYGPSVEDWCLVWDMDVEDLVGDFWEMLENSSCAIPGAWDPEWDSDIDELKDHAFTGWRFI